MSTHSSSRLICRRFARRQSPTRGARPEVLPIHKFQRIFYGSQKVRISLDAAMANPDSVMSVKVYYRWQKNGDHGQMKLQSRNTAKPHLCLVRAWLRIVQQFIALRGKMYDVLLYIYKHTAIGKIRNITSDDVRTSCTSWQWRYTTSPIQKNATCLLRIPFEWVHAASFTQRVTNPLLTKSFSNGEAIPGKITFGI